MRRIFNKNGMKRKIIITAPSLDPTQNVSGVSSVANFIIDNNHECEYVHFQLGKMDKEKGGWRRVLSILRSYGEWKKLLSVEMDALVHYSFPLSAPSILRDPMFMYYAYKEVRDGSRGARGMVVHVHGGLFLTAPKIPFVLNRILKWVFSWNVPFIVLSEGEKRTLQERFYAKRVYVLPNCPSLPEDIGLVAREEVSRAHGLEIEDDLSGVDSSRGSRVLTLGYLGRIEPNKGMTELLKACEVLKKNNVKFKLRFAGKEQKEGEYLPLYERLNEKLNKNKNNDENERYFDYVGLVSGKTKDEFLRSLDVFVMPTYFEGLPVSLLECMGYGVVPVVTPVGSIPDVVVDWEEVREGVSGAHGLEVREDSRGSRGSRGANGVFVKVKDVDSIVEAITMLDNDRELLGRLGRNARKVILENFSAERYVEQLNDIYNSI